MQEGGAKVGCFEHGSIVTDVEQELSEGPEIRVLLVEDDEPWRIAVERVLRKGDLHVTAVADGPAALGVLEREQFDVLLVDVHMPHMTGPELLAKLKASGCTAEVVMMSGSSEVSTAVAAVKAGAFGFLTKPFFSHDAVLIELRKAAQTKRLHETAERLRAQLFTRPPSNEILGSSPKMRELSRLLSGVATSESTILVLGESGTGKELVARAIHERSRRAAKPFVSVNCGALPSELIESELFGHARGAFTSAISARAGLFEAAHGGTLLLDEIGELPMAAQVKLLRALQEGEIRPVGSDRAKSVDVRVVAATNVDLRAAMTAGKFRQDLFYRLNVVPLQLPPLRERGDDILLLAQHFLVKHAHGAGRGLLRLSDEVSVRLRGYAWPGNVRELEHAIEHAVVFTVGDVVEVTALPQDLRRPPVIEERAPEPPASSEGRPMSAFLSRQKLDTLSYLEARQRVLADFNDAYVAAALAACGGNISEAARRSGVDRSNFRRLMRATAQGKDDKT